MPLALPMKFSTSRRLALVKRTCSGSCEVGFRIGPGCWRRAASRIASIAGLGRDASSFSRIFRSSSAARPMATRFDPS